MKRFAAVIAAVLVVLLPAFALASGTEAPPAEVLALKSYTDGICGYLSFRLPDGSIQSFWLDAGGLMDGFRCENGEWSIHSQVSPVDGTWDAQLVRHDPAVVHPDGSHYQDDLGFDIVCRKTGRRISYHYNTREFVLCGWENPVAYAGVVMLNGLWASYYPAGASRPEASCRLGEYSNSIMMSFDDLPFTPAQGHAQAAITEAEVKDDYPGYTLRYYESYNANTAAYACYSRIEDGLLHVKRVRFSDGEAPEAVDCVPLPLSQMLLDKLETEAFEELLDISGFSSLFRTEAALDAAFAPGRILDSDLQQHGLFVLAEDSQGTRRLHWITREGTGYRTQSTQPLPEKAWLDVFHASDGQVLINWLQADAEERRECYASYSLRPDGSWQLGAVMHGGRDDAGYSVSYCGLRTEYRSGSSDGILVGTLPGMELFSADLLALPAADRLTPALDRSGWAKVSNPDPADRLHLRTYPDKKSASLGRFYNGTPVQVLEEHDEWCRVQIGTDGRLTGWMMKEYLVFGTGMDDVACAFPQQVLREKYDGQLLYASQAMEEQTVLLEGEMWVVGIAEGNLYVLLTQDGGTAYAPIHWFFEGNG